MKLLGTVIDNFMAIGHADIALADRGLVLVQGDNQDESSATSNGAGKSSFADGVSWCFYGTTARGEEGDKVVNRFVGKDCSVVNKVQDGGFLYEIARYRKHKLHKNALKVFQTDAAGTRVDLTKGTEKMTQEVVNSILGCSHEVFVGAVYAGQEKMPDLPGMTDKNLKMLIEEASGATLLEAAYAEAQTRLRTAKASVDAVTGAVDKAKLALDAQIIALDDAETGRDKFEADRLEAIKAIHAAALTNKTALETVNKQIAASEKADDLLKQIGAIDAAIEAIAGERTKEAALVNEHAKAERAGAIAKSALLASEEAQRRADKALNDLAHQVGCPCRTCARPYSAEDIAPAQKLAAADVETAKREIIERKNAVSKCDSLTKIAADALEKYRASMTDASASNKARGVIDAKIRAVRDLENQAEHLVNAVRGAVNQIKVKQTEVNPFIVRVAAAEKARTLAESGLKGLVSDLELDTKALKVAETIAKVFSPAGVRAFLLDEVTPFLNDQTAKYLGTLSDGNITATWTTLVKTAKGELREKFSIEVENVNGGNTFGLISGGEKRKVRIACALALQDLVARRATKPIELFIGDEIDDALDPAGIERLTTILEEKAKERGSVFIISHSNLKDWIRNTITVTRKGKMATFTEAVS